MCLRLSLAVTILLALATAAHAAEPRLHLPGKADTGHTISLDADVPCAPAKAYMLWSTRDGARSFFAPDAEIGPVGGAYNVIFFPPDDPKGVRHGTAGAHVLAAEPGRFYAFEWVVFAGDKTKGDNAPPYAPESLRRPPVLPTWVELTFTPAPGGTHVAFRHYGFADGDPWSQSQAWFTRAWSGVLASMKQACARA